MKTKLHTVLTGTAAALCLAALSLSAAEGTKLGARSGSKLRLEGTSNIHDWQVQATLIGGTIEVGPNFPLEAGQKVSPEKVDVKGEAWVNVASLKSIEKDGRPYSDRMDEVMYEHLKKPANPKVFFFVDELTLKEAPKGKDDPYVFDAKGQLVVAGVTNKIALPVTVTPTVAKTASGEEKRIKIAGNTEVKMGDFRIEPPSPNIPGGSLIKTSEVVKIIFEWMVGPNKPTATASK